MERLGDFSDVKVPKLSVRLGHFLTPSKKMSPVYPLPLPQNKKEGQNSFLLIPSSQSSPFSNIAPTNFPQLARTCIVDVPDIISKEGNVMNEGCGRVSLDIAEIWTKELKLDFVPAAFQVLSHFTFFCSFPPSIPGYFLYLSSSAFHRCSFLSLLTFYAWVQRNGCCGWMHSISTPLYFPLLPFPPSVSPFSSSSLNRLGCMDTKEWLLRMIQYPINCCCQPAARNLVSHIPLPLLFPPPLPLHPPLPLLPLLPHPSPLSCFSVPSSHSSFPSLFPLHHCLPPFPSFLLLSIFPPSQF